MDSENHIGEVFQGEVRRSQPDGGGREGMLNQGGRGGLINQSLHPLACPSRLSTPPSLEDNYKDTN